MYYASPIVPWMVWVLETRPFLWGPGSAPSPIDPGDEPLLHPTALRAPAAGGAAAARAANDGSHHVRRPGGSLPCRAWGSGRRWSIRHSGFECHPGLWRVVCFFPATTLRHVGRRQESSEPEEKVAVDPYRVESAGTWDLTQP